MTDKSVHPLVLVFYLDREMMKNHEIIKAFAESINQMIHIKKLNALALFMPTDDEERVECINPAIVSDEQFSKITKLISDIENNFSIGGIFDDPKEADDTQATS